MRIVHTTYPAAAIGLLLGAVATPAAAGDLLVNPDVYRSHAAGGPPPVIALPELLLAPPSFQFRHGNVDKTKGVADTVAGARRIGKGAVGVDGTADIRTFAALGAYRGAQGFVMGGYRMDEAGTFTDANGTTVEHGYDRDVKQLVLGWTPNADTTLRLIGVNDDISKEKQPHFGLDVLRNDRKVGRMILDRRNFLGDGNDIEVSLRVADLERRADNYTLRTAAGTQMRVAMDRTVVDGRIKAGFDTGAFRNTVAIGFVHDDHGAQRFNVTGGDTVNSERLPDIERRQAFANLETETKLGEDGAGLFQAGLRYDMIKSEPTRAHITPGGGPNAFFNVGPATLYQTYYGVSDLNVTDHNLSGRLRYEHKVSPTGPTLFGDLSRLVRSGDNLEKYHAVSGPVTQRWVGNPQISPEKHHKAEVGLVHQGEGFLGYQRKQPGSGLWDSIRISGSVFYDRVDDFITLDLARGQAGVLTSDSALIYRNVDATFAGFELDAQWNLTRKWAARANLTRTWAENTTDNRPVYQIPPMEANLLLDYTDSLFHVGTWNVGSRLRMVANQTRSDDDGTTGTGFDERTGGFATFDVYGGVQLHDRIALTGGVDNVFDKGYREYVKGTHVEANPTKGTIQAPGRTAYVRLIANF